MTNKINFYDNCFTFLRYVIAFQILIIHGVVHFNLEPTPIIEFISLWSGVPVFFALSGFLIVHSLEKKTTGKIYFKKRILRIYPELWIGIIINIIIILFFFPNLIKNFSFYLFNLTQASFFQFWTPEILRNYGVGTPNGSLWTITIFIQFYVAVYYLYPKLQLLNRKNEILLLIISIFFSVAGSYIGNILPQIIYKLYTVSLIPYWYLFYIGILLYKYKESIIQIIIKYFYFIIVFYLIYCFLPITIPNIYIDPIRGIFLCIITIGFGYKFKNIKIPKDYSYGIYIYHMIIINLFVHCHFLINYIGLLLVVAIVLIMSMISNKIIHFIKLKVT